MIYFENLMEAFISCEYITKDAFGWNLAQSPSITRIQVLACISIVDAYKGMYAAYLSIYS